MNSPSSADKKPIEITKSPFRKALYGALSQVRQADLKRFAAMLARYDEQIEVISAQLFEKLDQHDQSTFVQWFLLRWGNISVLSQVDIDAYHANVKRFTDEPKSDFQFKGKTLKRVNCSAQGYDFDLVQYNYVCGVHDIFYNQYEHGSVKIEKGDVIIDAGAFIGDTASLFNFKAGGDCTLHSFELLDENIELYQFNAAQNAIAPERYTINKLALTDVSGNTLKINNANHQGATSIVANSDINEDSGEEINSVSIDDYVEQQGITKLDFVKMDIEGAEREALEGARQTISRFKPKLAVCIYHLWDDPIVIPTLINELCADYRFYFKWVHLDKGWEAVLLADARDNKVAEDTNQPVSYIDTELTIDKAQIAISKLSAEFEIVSQKNRKLEYRYINSGFLKKTFIYDWYLKLKERLA